jgi:hypothetical protein
MATAIAVLWKKRSCAITFLGPTAAFMRHLGLAGRAGKHGGKPQRATVSPITAHCAAFFAVGSNIKHESRNGDFSWSNVVAER